MPLDEHCVNAALAVCAAAGEADVATRLLRRCSALGAAGLGLGLGLGAR